MYRCSLYRPQKRFAGGESTVWRRIGFHSARVFIGFCCKSKLFSAQHQKHIVKKQPFTYKMQEG